MSADQHGLRQRPSDGMIKTSKKRISRRCKWIICVSVSVPLLVLLILVTVVSLRALTVSDTPTPRAILERLTSTKGIEPKGQMERAERLAGAIRIKTVSYEAGRQDFEGLLQLHDYLNQSFPLVHNSEFIDLEVVNNYSLLYTVTGFNNSGKLPYLLASHMDVVPATPSTWDEDPFGGKIVNDTYIYGRGTIDNKNGVMAILEALEYMISQGEQPKRNFFLAFGHDEEILGYSGAQEIANVLQRRGVDELDFVYDEGTPILKGVFPGISRPVATIGVTEKGFATVNISVSQSPGHSSIPPRHTAIGILSTAITRLEDHPQPLMFGTGPETAMFEAITPAMSFGYRAIFANLWLFSKLVTSIMEKDPKMNAILRTTTAVTIIKGGEKVNIVPGNVYAVINHRVHPSQTIEEVLEYEKKIIDDPRVSVELLKYKEAHKISPFGPDDIPYQLMAATLRQTFPEISVAPGMLLANTDTKWYLNHTNNIFRFFPLIANKEDLPRYHGNNERISVEGFQTAVDFFYRLISNAEKL